MSSYCFDPKKLFKSSANQLLDEVIRKGLRRTTKKFYEHTPMSQRIIVGKIADSVDLIAEIALEVEEEKQQFDVGRQFEQEMGVRFLKQRPGNKTRIKIEANASVFEETDVEYVVYEGILFAMQNSQNPTGRFDQVLLQRVKLLKNLKDYYQAGEVDDLSDESDGDEATAGEEGKAAST